MFTPNPLPPNRGEGIIAMNSANKTGKSAKPESLLVELLTEELPPKALRSLSEAFAHGLAENLRQDSFLEPDSAVEPYATPRRLALRITRVRDRAPDRLVESSGPSVKAGLDAKGQPTPALLGFAKKHGVEVGKLARRQTPKGEFFFCTTTAKGGRLDANLALKVAAALEVLPIPKVMRWGSGDQQFARPRPVLVRHLSIERRIGGRRRRRPERWHYRWGNSSR